MDLGEQVFNVEASYKQALSSMNMLMLAPAGSELLGLNSGSSDRDEMGICLETPEQLLGFNGFEQRVYRSAEERTGITSAPSQEGDIDLVVYGLRKFTRLALGGNPNLVSMLFIPPARCLIHSPIAQELYDLRKSFISKRTGAAFLGYMRAQRERLEGTRGQRDVRRQELVDKFGFDTKYAMHMLRLGWQCCVLLENKDLPFPVIKPVADYLVGVRNGNHSLGDCLRDAKIYEDRIQELLDSPAIPKRPDQDLIEKWLLSVYKRSWFHDSAEKESSSL